MNEERGGGGGGGVACRSTRGRSVDGRDSLLVVGEVDVGAELDVLEGAFPPPQQTAGEPKDRSGGRGQGREAGLRCSSRRERLTCPLLLPSPSSFRSPPVEETKQ